MSIEEQLGTLIFSLNPYTERGLKIMNFAHTAPGTDIDAVKAAASTDNLGGLEMEVADKYAEVWDFKGEPQKVNKAVRVKYRWPKIDPTNPKKILY